jgi:hypothetical protein
MVTSAGGFVPIDIDPPSLCSAGAKWASPSTSTDRARSYSVASTLVMQITEGVLNAKPDDDLPAAADRLASH